MRRVHNTKLILWLITGLAAAVALNRFVFGLGVTTNLNDKTPWGLWIGFDVMGGVALAAGGFVVTAIFYIMRRDEFHPLVKSAVLTAFLGYIAVILSLFFDLGLPWNIWHLIIFWNPESPLFEVGWCVMLYTTVLLLEFSPVPLEKTSRYAKIRAFLMKFRFPLVLLGIMLSTLHQSSLGSLFLIMPYRLYPLWYSHILPVEFFISAIALGLMIVAFETLISHWIYHRKPETELVGKLCRAAVWVLAIYFFTKMIDIIAQGKFDIIFNGSWQSNLFIVEVLVSTLIPAVMFSIPKLSRISTVQWTGSIMVVVGMVLNRMDVGGLAMVNSTASYTPSWTEIVISLGIVSLVALVFIFAIENFKVWDTPPEDAESLPHTQPKFDGSSKTWLGTPSTASLTVHTFAFVISFGVGMALFSGSHLHSKGVNRITVVPASGIDTLRINGNRDDQFVDFPHSSHISWLKTHVSSIGEDSCDVCHHLNLPGEKLSKCSECHTNMYAQVDFFKHDWHTSNTGANLKCNDCHTPGLTRNALSAKNCTDCHATYDSVANDANSPAKRYYIPSYADAMHNLCVSCHRIEAKIVKDKPKLAQCSTCHKTQLPDSLIAGMKWKIKLPHFDNVILPAHKSVKMEKKLKDVIRKENINSR